jgi:hypothetical protein
MQMLLGGSADIGRSLYYIGLSLIAQPGATVQRDLYGITLGATLGAANIGRDIRAVIGPIEILRLVLQAFGYQVDWPLLTPPEISAAPRLTTNLSSAAGALSMGLFRGFGLLSSSSDLPGLKRSTDSAEAQQVPADQVNSWLTARLRELVTYLVFALLAIWLFRSQLDGSAAAGRARPWAALGYGLLGMLLVFNIYLLALVLAAAVFAIGLFLGTATLWGLALAFWAVGLSVIAIATTLLMLFMVYGTKIIAAYWFGRLVLNPIAPGALRYRLVPLLLGLIVFLLLQSISIVGWVFAVLATAFGLGSAWLYYSGRRKSKDLPQEGEPAPLLEPVSAAEPGQESGEAVTEAAEPISESAPALDVQETSTADIEVK